MAVELITKEDLQQFKSELFSELQSLLQNNTPAKSRQWLKSYEVREMLGISRGTLQNMRVNGTLTATKIGGLMFYAYADIVRLMQNNKNSKSTKR